MTELTKNDDVRRFLGLPIEGDKGYIRYRRQYTPRPIEDLRDYLNEAWDQGILAITWHQYTPGFNDGEPCEFSVYDVSVTKNEEVAELWLDGDFNEDRTVEVSEAKYLEETADSRWYTPYFKEEEDGKPTKYFRTYEEGAYDYIPGSSHPDGVESDDVNLPLNDLEFEDALRSTFGDGTQVVLAPGRAVQFEYYHE